MLLRLLAHHEGAADPDLLDQIKERLDSLIGLDAWAVVLLLVVVIVAIPVGIMVLFALQRRWAGPQE